MRTTTMLLTITLVLPLTAGVALAATVRGTAGNDILRGTNGPDIMRGYAGSDTMSGGYDVMRGNRHGDRMYGGPGAEVIDSGAGGDFVNVAGDATRSAAVPPETPRS